MMDEATVAAESQHPQQLGPVDCRVAAVLGDVADAGVHLHDARERCIDARAVEQVAGVEADAEPRRADVVHALRELPRRADDAVGAVVLQRQHDAALCGVVGALAQRPRHVGPDAALVRLALAEHLAQHADDDAGLRARRRAGGSQPANTRTTGAPR